VRGSADRASSVVKREPAQNRALQGRAASPTVDRAKVAAVRIVGGEFRGRPLATPRSDAIRPTTDRTREALFNILAHRFAEHLDGARVLDLFAGTGALGLEALSRGAGFALFIEESAEGRGLIRGNVEAFGLTGRSKIFRRDATDLGEVGTMQPFGLLFADPPYGKGLGERALQSAQAGGWLVAGALCVVEENAAAAFIVPAGFTLVDERSYGDTVIRMLEAQ
jgi:16S rRNA (guanine966-N2)-methyltransferase